MKGRRVLNIQRVVSRCYDRGGKQRDTPPGAASTITFVGVGKVAELAVPSNALVRRACAADRHPPALVEAEGFVVGIAHLGASYPLRGLHKEVRHTRDWLLYKEHAGQHAVAPYDKKDAIEHAPVLLFVRVRRGVAEGLVRARREEVSSVPPLESQHQTHVHASMHARN